MASKITVIEIKQEDWDLPQEHHNASIFLSSQWIKSVSDADTRSVYIEFRDNENVVGKIAGIVTSRGKGNYLYFYSGPLIYNWSSSVFRQCLYLLKIYAQKKHIARVYIKSFDYKVSDDVMAKGYFRLLSREFILDYRTCTNGLNLNINFKRNVSKAQKAGALFFKSRKPEHLNKMLTLINFTQQTRVEKYGKQYDPMYMANLNRDSLNNLIQSGLGVLNCVELDGEVHSVLFSLETADRLYFLLMGSDQMAYKNGLAAFLNYKVSEDALNRGLKYYNMGLIPIKEQGGEGVKRHKESQGATEVVSYSYYTHYLTFPLKLMNPVIRISKMLPENIFFNHIRRVLS